MKITCPKCGASLRIITADPAEVHACPKCQARFRAPAVVAGGMETSRVDDEFSDEWLSGTGPPRTASPPNLEPPTVPPATASPAAAPADAAHATSRAASPPEATLLVAANVDDAVRPAPSTAAKRPPAARPSSPTPPPAPELPPLSLDDDSDAASPPVGAGRVKDGAGHVLTASDPSAYEFTATCPVCATRIDVDSSCIGGTQTCPDCFHVFPILAPPVKDRRTPFEQLAKEGNPFERLQVDDPSRAAVVLATAEATKRQADQILAQAARELQEQKELEQDGKFDDHEAASLLHFMIAQATLIRLVALCVLGVVAVALVIAATDIRKPSGPDFISLFIWIVTIPTATLWFVALAAHALAILRDTSNDFQDVRDWPTEPLAAIGQALFVAAALFFSGLPGMVLAVILSAFGFSFALCSLPVFVSWYLLFSPVQLSLLFENSLVIPYSRRMVAAIFSVEGARNLYLQASAALWFLLWLASCAVFWESTLFAVPIAVAFVVLNFIHFRILGWLGREALRVVSESDAS